MLQPVTALEKLQGFEGTEAAGVLGTGSEDEILKDRQVWKVEGGQDGKITMPYLLCAGLSRAVFLISKPTQVCPAAGGRWDKTSDPSPLVETTVANVRIFYF